MTRRVEVDGTKAKLKAERMSSMNVSLVREIRRMQIPTITEWAEDAVERGKRNRRHDERGTEYLVLAATIYYALSHAYDTRPYCLMWRAEILFGVKLGMTAAHVAIVLHKTGLCS